MNELFSFIAWFAVVGLMFDILGVTILAVEVWRATTGNETFLSGSEQNLAHSSLGPAPIDEEVDNLFEEAISILPQNSREAFSILNEKIAILEFSERASHKISSNVEGIASNRRKTLILTGTSFLVFGFLLQILATTVTLIHQ